MPSEVEVEVNLRIPSLTIRTPNEPKKVTDNGSVRFLKRVSVPGIPKPGTTLQLTTATGSPFDSEVIRADWNEDKQMFVVYCRYSKKSISMAEYNAIVTDADWEMRPLL